MFDQTFWVVGIVLLFVVVAFIDPMPTMEQRIQEQ